MDAAMPVGDRRLRLRLAAMAGHMAGDKTAARRAALIDLLADGRPHTCESIWEKIAADIGEHAWGKRPGEMLQRDLLALRRGGLRIGYSRKPGVEGYYLQYPPVETPQRENWSPKESSQTERIRQMTVPEKNEMAFGAADFALRQKRLILAEEQPDWPAEQVEREARRLVFGV
jgi:hypothetical protein